MHRSLVIAFVGVLLPFSAASAGAGPAKLSAAALAGKIDEHIVAKWKTRKIVPAPRADDAELVRRLFLDLNGRIPDILSARDFAENPAKDKRSKQIDALLASDRYPAHFANVWRSWIIPVDNDQNGVYNAALFETWLRNALKNNTKYNEIVTEVVTARTPAAVFYQANQSRPENLAAAASRLFLGVKLECAQCHNHPFARWQRRQFWEFAAFFVGDAGAVTLVASEIKIPGTDKTVKARFLDGTQLPKGNTLSRAALAEWMTAKDNPYFARAAVNRLWEYFLGVGLVEPVDEETTDNPPSHPDLLTLLAKQFAANDFDLKYLIRAITLSQTYQRSSKLTHRSQADARLFARMKVRGMSPEQLFDSLALATGQKDEAPINPNRGVDFNSPRIDFLRRFSNQDKRSEQQTSILQALYLMNGRLVADATSLELNKNLAIIAQATAVPTTRRLEQLFLIALSRKPTTAERDRLVHYIDKGGPSKNLALALCDVFWALLNASEFCVNH